MRKHRACSSCSYFPKVLWAKKVDKLYDAQTLPLRVSTICAGFYSFTVNGITGVSLHWLCISSTKTSCSTHQSSSFPSLMPILRRFAVKWQWFLYSFSLILFVLKPVYDSFLLTMYNITFTGLPVFIFTVLDQNFTEKQLLSNLHLYGSTAGDARMSWKQFFKWNGLGNVALYNRIKFFIILDLNWSF